MIAPSAAVAGGLAPFNASSTVAPLLATNASSLCYCWDADAYCLPDATCVRRGSAACFKSASRRYDERTGAMATHYRYGCLHEEVLHTAGSPMQCHGHLTQHSRPTTIACCYEGNLCNRNLTLPLYNRPTVSPPSSSPSVFVSNLPWAILLILGLLMLGVAFVAVLYFVGRHKARKGYRTDTKLGRMFMGKHNAALLDEEMHNGFRKPSSDIKDMIDSSTGSGSGLPELMQRTIARQLTYSNAVGKGRYGEVWLASWKGEHVAVKIFFTTEEASWRRETELYNTCMLRHENILGFIAADIAGTGSVTQMLLISEYHPLGSLYDYLKAQPPLAAADALHLMHSAAAGLSHLHDRIDGTRGKPAIAHRDIKSKNILVKNARCAVLADFGFAVKLEPTGQVDAPATRVGTKRYMPPEVLDGSMDYGSFDAFKQADMYSFALVLWEVARRIQDEFNMPPLGDNAAANAHSAADNAQQQQMHLDRPQCPSTDSGMNQSSKWSAGATGSSGTALPYQSPFEEKVPSDPSFEEMKQIVCSENYRPRLEELRLGVDTPLCRLTVIMKECWYKNPASRLTALRVKKSLKSIIEEVAAADSTASSDRTLVDHTEHVDKQLV